MKPLISKTCLFNGMWMSAILWALIIWGVAQCCSCQRTDYQFERDPNGVTLLYVSNTSWCTDSNSKSIAVDPNGVVTVTGYGKQEDSLDVEIDPLKRKGKLSTSPKPTSD